VNVPLTLARIDKEMKHGAIMPYIERVGWQIGLGDISTKPTNALSGFSEPCSGYIQRGLGDIQDCWVMVSTRQKIINQG